MHALALICIIGTLSQYALGVMPRVIYNRQHGRAAIHLPRQLPQVDGYIAARDCSDIGKVWTLVYKQVAYTVLVTDCAGSRRTRRWMTPKAEGGSGVIAEVDYEFARAHGFARRAVKAELCMTEPQP